MNSWPTAWKQNWNKLKRPWVSSYWVVQVNSFKDQFNKFSFPTVCSLRLKKRLFYLSSFRNWGQTSAPKNSKTTVYLITSVRCNIKSILSGRKSNINTNKMMVSKIRHFQSWLRIEGGRRRSNEGLKKRKNELNGSWRWWTDCWQWIVSARDPLVPKRTASLVLIVINDCYSNNIA